MKVVVVFGSQRRGGTHSKIEEVLNNLNLSYEYDFIRMAETRIEACSACEACSKTGRCVLPASPNDMFHNVLERLVAADVILIITPVYAPIPSRLTALFERLLSVSYFSHERGNLERPLKDKKTAIVCYDSVKIGDDMQLKIIFQKYLMDNYSFTKVDYNYLNHDQNPNEKYRNVIEYVKHILLSLESA